MNTILLLFSPNLVKKGHNWNICGLNFNSRMETQSKAKYLRDTTQSQLFQPFEDCVGTMTCPFGFRGVAMAAAGSQPYVMKPCHRENTG